MDKANDRGMSLDRINKLMTDIYDYADKSNRILKDIESLANDTQEYFVSDEANLFRNKISELLHESTTINKNILSYNTDMMTVKNRYMDINDGGLKIMQKAVNSVEERIVYKEER